MNVLDIHKRKYINSFVGYGQQTRAVVGLCLCMAVLWQLVRWGGEAGGENLIFWHVGSGGVWEDGGGVLVVAVLLLVGLVCNKSKSLFVLVFIWFNWLVGWLFCTVAGCLLV